MGVTELQQTLSTQRLIFVDTMVFIYVLYAHPTYVKLAATVFDAIEQGKTHGVTSTLTLAEILTAPAQAEDAQAMRDYELYLTNFPNLQLQAPDVAIARLAARVRAATRLRMPDAIQIGTAISVGASAIVGNDKGWRNKVNKPMLILLDDFR
jgi:predicted nucleic acid-binding protein